MRLYQQFHYIQQRRVFVRSLSEKRNVQSLFLQFFLRKTKKEWAASSWRKVVSGKSKSFVVTSLPAQYDSCIEFEGETSLVRLQMDVLNIFVTLKPIPCGWGDTSNVPQGLIDICEQLILRRRHQNGKAYR